MKSRVCARRLKDSNTVGRATTKIEKFTAENAESAEKKLLKIISAGSAGSAVKKWAWMFLMGRALIIFSLFFLSSLLSADEVDRLLEEVRPPARFADLDAKVTVGRQVINFDGEKIVLHK